MIKYLRLKTLYTLSDVDVVERSRYDMSFKYFLGMCPEEEVINPSSFTKIRKLRPLKVNCYKPGAKNSELKNAHGYGRAISYNIQNMEMQGALAICAADLKRLLSLGR